MMDEREDIAVPPPVVQEAYDHAVVAIKQAIIRQQGCAARLVPAERPLPHCHPAFPRAPIPDESSAADLRKAVEMKRVTDFGSVSLVVLDALQSSGEGGTPFPTALFFTNEVNGDTIRLL